MYLLAECHAVVSGDTTAAHPLSVGAPATYNLLHPSAPDRPLSALPVRTVVRGTEIDRPALAREIADLRAGTATTDLKGTAA